jgi:hypothetical protein
MGGRTDHLSLGVLGTSGKPDEFHLNNELAGYCSVLHAMTLVGSTGHYGRQLRAVVIGFGNTARGAITALHALGVHDVTVLTMRDVTAVASPIPSIVLRSATVARRLILRHWPARSESAMWVPAVRCRWPVCRPVCRSARDAMRRRRSQSWPMSRSTEVTSQMALPARHRRPRTSAASPIVSSTTRTWSAVTSRPRGCCQP